MVRGFCYQRGYRLKCHSSLYIVLAKQHEYREEETAANVSKPPERLCSELFQSRERCEDDE